MKVTWESDDIRPGRVVGVPGRGEFWIIGYDVRRTHDEGRRILVSLRDGMLAHGPCTDAAMATHLNESGEQPIEVIWGAYQALKVGS